MGTQRHPSMWAGYRLCAGVFQEDGMAAILTFLWIEARPSSMIGKRRGRSTSVDRALTTMRSIVACRCLSEYRKSDSFLRSIFYTLAAIRQRAMAQPALDIADLCAGVLHRSSERMPEAVKVDAQTIMADCL